MRSCVFVLASIGLLACAEKPERRTPPVLRWGVVDASAAVAIDPKLLELARAALNSATAFASTCRLQGTWYDTHYHFVDDCTGKPARPGSHEPTPVEQVRAAARALSAAAPDAGPVAAFAAHVRMFAESLESERTSGPLARYQDLARAWNELAPAEAVPIDVVTKYELYGEKPLDVRGDGGAIVWSRCSGSPCIIVPREPRR